MEIFSKFNDHFTQKLSRLLRWLHFRKIFLSGAETHAIFLFFHVFLWCSFTNNAWSHETDKRDKNKSGPQALWILISLARPKKPLSATSSYIQKFSRTVCTPETHQQRGKINIAFCDTAPALSIYLKISFNEKVQSHTSLLRQIFKNHLSFPTRKENP